VPLSPPSVTTAPFEQHLAGIASNGRDFLAIWFDRRSTIPSRPYVYGAVPLYVSRLDGAGRPPNPFGTKLTDAISAAIVWTSGGYVVLWSNNNETDSMLLDDDGLPVSTPKQLVDGYLVTAASNGRTILVLHGPYSSPRVASLFKTDGTLVSRTTLDPTNHYAPGMRPMIMPNGDYGLIAQAVICPFAVCSTSAALITISENGMSATKPLRGVSEWSQSTAAIGNGRLMLASVNDYNAHPPARPARTLSFRIFDPAGNPLTSETTVASSNDIQTISGAFGPSVGWDGQNFLLSWQWPTTADERSGEIRAVRVTMDGIVINGSPMLLSPTLGSPAWFASNGTNQIVAWDTSLRQTSDIDFRSALTFDTLDDAETRIIPESAALQTELQLAGRFAVWREGDSNPSIVTALLGGPAVTISPAGTLDQQAPAIGASSSQFLVVWREQALPAQPYNGFRILGKRVAANGAVIDRNPIVIAYDSSPLANLPSANTLAVGSDGAGFLVVWPAPGNRLQGARVTAAGVLVDDNPIDVSQFPRGTPGSPRVVWNGSEYIVVWTADPSCKLCFVPGPPVSQIFVARVSPNGRAVDSQMIWNGGYGSRVGLAGSAEGFMLAWPVSQGLGATCIYATPLRNDGTAAGSVQTLTCIDSPWWPPQFPDFDLAWDGTAFIAAWTLLTSNATVVKGMRISPNGFPVDAAPFDFAPAGAASFQPALASSDGGVIVAYSRIASEPQYGNVARVFVRTLQQLNPPLRRRASR